MEQRMTICNMSIEGGARAGLIAPDDTTFEYVQAAARAAGRRVGRRGRPLATAPTDDGATFDKSITIDATSLEPMITYGTNPGMGIPITSRVPPTGEQQPDALAAPRPRARARVHGPPARAADPRPEGRRRLRRVVHERADQRPLARAAALKDRRSRRRRQLMVTSGHDE
jgi:homoaconitase/3-isopropylmalate dehydratase large subunit